MTRRKFLKLFGKTGADVARGRIPSRFFVGQRVLHNGVPATIHFIYERWDWACAEVGELMDEGLHLYVLHRGGESFSVIETNITPL